MKRSRYASTSGYTLIELMMVVAIISLLFSMVTPKFNIILTKAHQAKAKNNLGNIRSALALYYTENEGKWPLQTYPEGTSHFADGFSLSTALTPKYLADIPTPELHDGLQGYNGLSVPFDLEANRLMGMNPPNDVFIVWGDAVYTPLLNSPYAYDNTKGSIYYPNGNYDSSFNYFYTW